MSYLLKHFDTSLLKFSLSNTPLAGLQVNIIEVYPKQNLLPLDLELSEQSLLNWLKRRTIPKNRAFVQEFLAKLGLNINDTQGIIDICKGLSLNDCYWVVEESFTGQFADYNLYENRFNRTLALIAYTGYGETQRSAFMSTPELTTDGMLAKCWRRVNGKILLYKAGTTGAANTGNEPYSEFYACQVAQAMGLPSVQYNLSRWKQQLFSTCELFTSQHIAYMQTARLVTAGGWLAVFEYYQQLGEDFYQNLIDMLVLDAVICNEDRHFGNFGLLINTQTNQIIQTAPVFDHGMSLFNYAMDDDLDNIQAYAQTRAMRGGQDFIQFAKEIMTPQQKQKLKKLINFKFKKHPRYNLSKNRLKSIETFMQQRIQTLLNT